ncbi:lytic transglycosylase domain-containing protein [Patescibacteria group bacterium]|nr:lytic transglycosylase domain-containing protein [Patescibacteria group bacterium]
MADDNFIRSYLIGLGFKVDAASLNKMKDSLKQVGREVKDTSAKISSDSRWASAGFSQAAAGFTTAAKAIAAAFTSVTVATVKLFDKTSQADLGYQKFALKMYMAKDVAKEFKIVTDAMGESFEDIAWIPELTQRYRALMMDAHRMALPKDADAQFKYLRSIRHEFDRLKVEATYGMQWVGMALFKHLQEPITKIKEGAVKLNDYIMQNMPEISEKIAGWVSKVLLKGYEFGLFIKDLFGDLKELHGQLPEWAQSWGTWAAAITAIFVVGGPVTKAFIAIGLAVAGIRDFYAYLDGTESSPTLAPVWAFLLDALFEVRAGVQTIIFTWEKMRKLIEEGIDLPDWLQWLKDFSKKDDETFLDPKTGKLKPKEPLMKTFFGESDLPGYDFGETGRKAKEKALRERGGVVKEEDKSINQLMDEWREEELRGGRTPGQVMREKIKKSLQSKATGIDYEYEATKGVQYGGLISKAAKKFMLDEAIIKAIIQRESSFKERAIGTSGEKGLMQLMPVHTKGMEDPFDPEENIMRGSKFYRDMLNKYKSEKKAIAAFHIGETEMNRYGGIPSYAEKYVEDVLRFKEQITNNNNITINIMGQTNEELISKVEEVVRRASAGDTVRMIRTAGVAP